MTHAHPAFVVVLALATGILAQSIARHLRLPGIVLLLCAGVGLGPDGLNWIDPQALGSGLFPIVELAVAIILFEGGLNLKLSRLLQAGKTIRRLVTVGALVTFAGATAAAHILLGWAPIQALMFGSLVVVTGPTVVGPLVDGLRLRHRVATVLEAEGVLIDPIGVILAVLVLEVALAPDGGPLTEQATELLKRFGLGVGIGAASGVLLAYVMRIRNLVPEGLEKIFVLASVLLLFQGSEQLVSHSGVLAVTVAGIVMGNMRTRVDRDLREFKEEITVLMIGLIFVLLAADVRLSDVQALGWSGFTVVACLVLVVRPLNVCLATLGSDLEARERAFISWIAPRGIVSAAVASVAAGALSASGVEGGEALRALVFLTIAVTVTLAGVTAAPMGTLLGVRMPGREAVAILGAGRLAMVLAEEFRSIGRSVVFVDSNPDNCRRAEEAGHTVVLGDGVQERTLQRARFESVQTAIGFTPNQILNSVYASRARELFGVPSSYVAAARPTTGLAPELVESDEVSVLFEGAHDVDRWDVRLRHGDAALERWAWQGAPEADDDDAENGAAPSAGERFIILAIRRGDSVVPMSHDLVPTDGDVAAVVVNLRERDEATQNLETMGWRRVEPT